MTSLCACVELITLRARAINLYTMQFLKGDSEERVINQINTRFGSDLENNTEEGMVLLVHVRLYFSEVDVTGLHCVSLCLRLSL